jgi:hypothetical protein
MTSPSWTGKGLPSDKLTTSHSDSDISNRNLHESQAGRTTLWIDDSPS